MTTCRMAAALAGAVLAIGWARVPVAAAAVPVTEVVVTVTGESAHSFEEAKEDALRRAVEMGAGKEVFGDTRVADFTLRHDTIISRAAGYVRSHDVLEKKEVQGVYSVRVQAVVAVGQVRDDWGAIQVLLQRKGQPRLLVVVMEEGQGLTWTGNAAEYRLRELFGEKGFKIIDDETLAAAAGRDMTRAMLVGDERKAAAVAQQLHATHMVLGRAMVRAGPRENVYGVWLSPVNVDLLLKVVAADNAEQLASKTASAKRASEDPTSAAKQALDLAAADVWPELLRRILYEWSLDLDRGATVTVQGTRIPTTVLNGIVEGLRRTEHVKSATIVDHNAEMSTLSVMTRLEAMQLGKVIEQISGGAAEVAGISPGRVEIKAKETAPAVSPPPPSVATGKVLPAPGPRPEKMPSGTVPPTPVGLPPGPQTAPPAWLWPAAIGVGLAVAGLIGGLVLARRKLHRRDPATPVASEDLPSVSGPGFGAAASDDRAPFAPGDQVDGFDILEEVGRGGMGAVYRAYERSLRREVALKTILPEVAANPALLKRFRREAVLAANLSHPNIVPVFYIDERPVPRYFTMEFVRGESLKERLDREGPLVPAEAVRVALEVADALRCAHEHSIIHRDIKPRNILLEARSGRVRVTDFGIARDVSGRLAENTQTEGHTAGTPAFMSPEQVRGEDLDGRTDVFSLGATLYYMLTGRGPYEAEDRTAYLAAFKGEPPPLPSRLNAKVGPALDAAVAKMLAVDREKRYQSCAEVIADLKQA